MIFQDVLFLCDKEECLTKPDFFKQLRLSLYDLRNSAFKQDLKIRVNFSVIADVQNADFQFYDLDTFSISKENQNTIFGKHSWADVKQYFKSGKGSGAGAAQSTGSGSISDAQASSESAAFENIHSKKIIYLKSSELTPELTEDVQFYSLLKLEKVRMTTVHSTTLEDYSSSIHKTINKKAPLFTKIFSKKSALALLAGIFAVALISFVPLLVRQVKKQTVKYEYVYTGDGDRLIMREAPDRDAREVIRLHENEVVQIIQKGDPSQGEVGKWDQVNYHGLTGYCHNEYFMPARDGSSYVITNPEAQFLYGMSCLRYIDASDVDGWVWIKKASDAGVIRASWELARHYDDIKWNDTSAREQMISILKLIETNTRSVEDDNIKEWRRLADSYKASGNDELRIKFTNKAKELETDVKTIRMQSLRRLSEYYLDNNQVVLASDYYKKAINVLNKPNNEYMYKLAMRDELSERDSVWWLNKASDNGHGKSSYELAQYYDENEDLSNAIKYYKRSYNAGYKAKESAYAYTGTTIKNMYRLLTGLIKLRILMIQVLKIVMPAML